MADASDIEQVLGHACNEFLTLSQEIHLLCPKVSDDDEEDYDDAEEPGDIGVAAKHSRIEDGKKRVDLVYRCSLILGFPRETAAELYDEFEKRTTTFLTTCAGCVRNWHRNRKHFLKELSETQPDAAVTQMEAVLLEFDSNRISAGLQSATDFINAHNGMVDQKTFIEEEHAEMLIALYEALCCISYLSQPSNRVNFNIVFEKVQERRVLRLGEVLPTMTHFLFEEDKVRYTFARTAWSRMPRVSTDDFEWAVKDSLQDALQRTAMTTITTQQSQHFWEGLVLILKTLGQDIFVPSLGALDAHTNIYQAMLNHMALNSESNLAVVLKVFCIILRKGPRGLWGTFANYSPVSVAEQVFGSPAFRRLLNQTREYSISMPEDDTIGGPVAIAWVKPFIDSIPASQKGDICDAIMHHFLEDFAKDTSLSQEGRAVCGRGAAEALLSTLSAFIMPNFEIRAASSTIHTNRMLNLTLKYSDTLIGMTRLSPQNPHDTSVSQTALAVIGCALMLDSRVTAEEFHGFQQGDHKVQREVTRNSAGLWESFLEPLVPGAMQLAKATLLATIPLIPVEVFRPKKKESLSKPKELFNSDFRKTAEVIGRTIERLTDFSTSDLTHLCSDSYTIKPIVAALISGEGPINEAAMSLIKTVTDEISRNDAVSRLLELHFSPALISFTQAVNEITGGHRQLWSPQLQILNVSKAVLSGLCDAASGVLRSKSLTDGERAVLMDWWASQWAFIQAAFKGLDNWSKVVETDTMKNFCRDMMQLADDLLAQAGLLSSAMGIESGSSSGTVMQDLLAEPRDNCYGMVMMLRLKDTWLISITIHSLTKLFRRLAENSMSVPETSREFVRNVCTKNSMGKYKMNSNLTNQQRAELMRALGEDDDDDDVEIIDVNKFEAPKKQSRLDAWSKSAGDSTSTSTSTSISLKPKPTVAQANKHTGLGLTPTVDKSQSILSQMRASQAAKPGKKSVIAQPDPKAAASLKEKRQKEKEDKLRRDAEAAAKAKALRNPKGLVAGEGSGLQGLAGVIGKDHAPQKSEIMVGSSSEDESDSDDDAAFLEQTKASQMSREDAARRVKELKQQIRGPLKKTKIQRSQKDMRARLIPPMEVLHQAILDWDIFHEGSDPPNGVRCSQVHNTYGDPLQYKDTFFPLLIYEAWRSFVTAKDETTSKPFGIKVMNRMNVDKFIEVTTAMPMSETKDRWLAEGDIILLSTSARPLESPNDPHCLARIWRTTVKHGNLEASYRLSGKAGQILQFLAPKAEIHAVKITNMTTIEREYASLESLKYFDLMPEILDAKPSPMLGFSEENIRNVMTNYNLNQGQAKAILHGMENDGFTLVQGPPGTGKTKTIIAMVGALMTGSFSSNTGVAIKRPGAKAANSAPSKKLLVCAPSNAAVDELVLRLKAGVKSRNGTFHKINVIRLGRSDAINAAVRDVTLDELIKARIDGDKDNGGPTDRQKMHEEAGQIKKDLNELRPQLEAARATDDRAQTNILQRKFDELKRRQAHIGTKIDADKDSGNTAARENDIRKRQMQQEILDSAHVLCATLSGSGHEMFKNLNVEFETVIIDEAAQCVELSALIPLKYGCSKCILVGDPKQLPPTVLSQSAARYGYDQSLFVRMQRNHPDDIHLLDTQYRMHPEISQFPSQEFYERRLIDGNDMAKLRHQPWHQTGLLGPYRFFDVKGSQERGRKGQSLVNTEELKVAIQLYERFKLDNPRVELKGKVGIITPYKAQLAELRDRFSARYGEGIKEEIEFNTTDAFQGRECEIIIFSCVRASPTGGIGFMTDIRRMNVGLTRAKSSLWILGDSRALVQGEFWNKLIEDAKARDRYTTGDIISLLRKAGATLPPPSFSYVQNTVPQNREVKIEVEVEDVDMTDASPLKPPDFRNKTPQLPETYTILERHQPPSQAFNNLPSGYSGLNERGQAQSKLTSSGRPIIHSSGQKRPRDNSTDVGQPAKRAPSGFLPGKPIPTKPKNMPRPSDPAAMSVLGIEATKTASSRGGSKPTPPNPSNPSQGSSTSRPFNPMIPPKKKPGSDPFIKRKPTKPR